MMQKRDSSKNNGTGTRRGPRVVKTTKTYLSLLTVTGILKWTTSLNVQFKTTSFLEDNPGENLDGLSLQGYKYATQA